MRTLQRFVRATYSVSLIQYVRVGPSAGEKSGEAEGWDEMDSHMLLKALPLLGLLRKVGVPVEKEGLEEEEMEGTLRL